MKLTVTKCRSLNCQGWQDYVICFPPETFHTTRFKPVERYLALKEAIESIVSCFAPGEKVKILVDCNLSTYLMEDLFGIDCTSEILRDARRNQLLVKLISV